MKINNYKKKYKIYNNNKIMFLMLWNYIKLQKIYKNNIQIYKINCKKL